MRLLRIDNAFALSKHSLSKGNSFRNMRLNKYSWRQWFLQKYFGAYCMACIFDLVIVIVRITNKAGVLSQGNLLYPEAMTYFLKQAVVIYYTLNIYYLNCIRARSYERLPFLLWYINDINIKVKLFSFVNIKVLDKVIKPWVGRHTF